MNSKGRVTIPKDIRKRLGLKPGDRVEFVVEEGRTVIRPVRPEANPFEKFIGIAGPFLGGEEGLEAWLDGECVPQRGVDPAIIVGAAR
jgi:AbrB family looped-hinge helix DNA binding protein